MKITRRSLLSLNYLSFELFLGSELLSRQKLQCKENKFCSKFQILLRTLLSLLLFLVLFSSFPSTDNVL